MKTIKVMRGGRPATTEELNCAVEGKPLPPLTGSAARRCVHGNYKDMCDICKPAPERASLSGVRRRPCSCYAYCKGADGLAVGYYCEMDEAGKPLPHSAYRILKSMLWWSDGKDGRARFRTEITAGEICQYHNGVFVFPGRPSLDGDGVCPWLSRHIVEDSRDWFEPVAETSSVAPGLPENRDVAPTAESGPDKRVLAASDGQVSSTPPNHQYAITFEICSDPLFGAFIANTKLPYIVPAGMEKHAYNVLSRRRNKVFIADKETLLANGCDLCEEDFADPIQLPESKPDNDDYADVNAALKEGGV